MCIRVLVSPHPCQHLLFSLFYKVAQTLENFLFENFSFNISLFIWLLWFLVLHVGSSS